jgi:hypothetical protein
LRHARRAALVDALMLRIPYLAPYDAKEAARRPPLPNRQICRLISVLRPSALVRAQAAENNVHKFERLIEFGRCARLMGKCLNVANTLRANFIAGQLADLRKYVAGFEGGNECAADIHDLSGIMHSLLLRA